MLSTCAGDKRHILSESTREMAQEKWLQGEIMFDIIPLKTVDGEHISRGSAYTLMDRETDVDMK